MPQLTYIESQSEWIQHRTWTRIGETHPRPSPLANQFALREHQLPAEEAIAAYREWLWQEMQDEHNVVWREMSDLVNAEETGQDAEVLVPQGALHGDVIMRALDWMQQNTHPTPLPQRISVEPRGWFTGEITDGLLSVPAEIEAKQLVWITGNTQSRIGMIVEGAQAWVPDYGLVPMRNSRPLDQRLVESGPFQALVNQRLDSALETEMQQSPLEYEAVDARGEGRFDEPEVWQQDEVKRDGFVAGALYARAEEGFIDRLSLETADISTAHAVANLPEIEGASAQLIRRPSWVALSEIRPVYFSHRDKEKPLQVLSADDQVYGRSARPAKLDEVVTYIQTFGHAEPEKDREEN